MADCEMKSEEMTPSCSRTNQPAAEQSADNDNDSAEMDIDSLPAHVQQEIDDLCHFVPDVTNHFTIINKIGEGTFSSVFLAKLKHHPDVKELLALKHIIPTSHPNRILGELKCLQMIGGQENVMGLELCLRNKDHIVIVMRNFPHHRFQDYFNTLTVPDVQDYMKNLLIALRRVHQFDVIHRDIKPSNFLHNITTKQYTLVDFGLAHDAPVKKYAANKNRPPFVKDHKTHPPRKENAQLASPLTADSKSSGAVKKDVTTASTSRTPLSPIRSTSRSPRKEAAAAVPDGPKVPLLPRPPSKTGAASAGVFQPPPPPGSKGGRLGRQHHGVSAFGLGGQAVRRTPNSPRRTVLQKALMSADGRRLEGLSGSGPHAGSSGTLTSCECYGRPVVCTLCTARSVQSAQRAGTPGFRAPEVLMKHPHQSTAVDMWSAGVIFLSLVSGRYPFFRGNDDLMCLSQIISLLGTERVQAAAQSFDKLVTCKPTSKALDLKSMCERLRSTPETSEKHSANPTKQWARIPDSAIDLLHRLLDPNPTTRITAEEALSHEFLSET